MSFFQERINSFKNAFRGVFVFIREYGGAHVIFHIVATLFILTLGFYYQVTSYDWALLVIAISLVWITEIINSSIEQIIDLVHPEHGKMAGIIKDMAAGAVLIAAITAVILGAIVFYPYFS